MSLCEAARRNLQPIADALKGGSLTVTEEDENSCVINGEDISIRLLVDSRDGQLASTLLFPRLLPDDAELYTHIIGRLFELANPDQRALGRLPDKVRAECDSIAYCIREMDVKKLSPRDLYYFQFGYNSAYTDYASGEWDEKLR